MLTLRRRAYDRCKSFGQLTIDVFDARTNQLLLHEAGPNLVVNTGKDLMRDLLNGDAVGGLTKFKLGSSGTAAVVGDTGLIAQFLSDTITQKTKTAQKLTVKYYLSSLNGNGNTIREAGTTNALDVLYARYVLVTPIVKTVAVAVTFTWEFSWT